MVSSRVDRHAYNSILIHTIPIPAGRVETTVSSDRDLIGVVDSTLNWIHPSAEFLCFAVVQPNASTLVNLIPAAIWISLPSRGTLRKPRFIGSVCPGHMSTDHVVHRCHSCRTTISISHAAWIRIGLITIVGRGRAPCTFNHNKNEKWRDVFMSSSSPRLSTTNGVFRDRVIDMMWKRGDGVGWVNGTVMEVLVRYYE